MTQDRGEGANAPAILGADTVYKENAWLCPEPAPLMLPSG